MKRVLILLSAVMLFAATTATVALAAPPSGNKCATIQGGTITDSTGAVITTGFDEFGYNYQAHSFNGTYDSSDRNIDGTYWGDDDDYVDDSLSMKWSDSWLANVDCDGDGSLDRGLVDGEVNGPSMGWLTNHVVGDYFDVDGVEQHYTDFVKIVWTGPGSPLWGQYTLIQEVYNDPAGGYTGLLEKIGIPGLGLNDQWTQLP